jgi:hypothetical protein
MHRRRLLSSRASIWASICFLPALVAGCGDSLPERVPVSGRVMIDGQPLSQGAIMVAPQDERPSMGAIAADGSFTLSCYEKGDGAVPGTHKVSITATEPLNDRQVRWHAPKKYAHINTSGLTATIDGPTDDLVINLTWDGGKPFVESQ